MPLVASGLHQPVTPCPCGTALHQPRSHGHPLPLVASALHRARSHGHPLPLVASGLHQPRSRGHPCPCGIGVAPPPLARSPPALSGIGVDRPCSHGHPPALSGIGLHCPRLRGHPLPRWHRRHSRSRGGGIGVAPSSRARSLLPSRYLIGVAPFPLTRAAPALVASALHAPFARAVTLALSASVLHRPLCPRGATGAPWGCGIPSSRAALVRALPCES